MLDANTHTMSKPAEQSPKTTPDNPSQSVPSLNSPEIDEKSGKPTKRAISNAKQAAAIAKNIKETAVRQGGRITTAATILNLYNGANPFPPSTLNGQDWRANFSTNWLASIIDRMMPQLLDPIVKADLLTHSRLPDNIVNAADKGRTFCEIITSTVRRWPEWRDFIGRTMQETCIFGNNVSAWLDQGWRPKMWKYDEVYMAEGTGQHASKVQVVVFLQKMLLHDFIRIFQDKSVAEKAGYNVENCIKAANTSLTNARSKDPTPVEIQDALREGIPLSDTYDGGQVRSVDLYHVIVQDYSGEVDLWTVTQNDELEIRNVEAIQPEMSAALTLFTFQAGNGKFYGSKGLGRLLANLHIAIERGRCLAVDQLYLSGLLFFKTDLSVSTKTQVKIRHPFGFVEKECELIEQTISFEAANFESMDQKLNTLGNSMAGAFIPPNLNNQGSTNTKIEAAQNAERELAVKEGTLGRAFAQVADLMSTIQSKICSPINLREAKRAFDKKQQREAMGIKVLMRKVWKILTEAFGPSKLIEPELEEGIADEEAVAAIVMMLEKGLALEEIVMLANSPSAPTSPEEGAQQDGVTLQYIANNRLNPYVDQQKATEMEAQIAIGEERAAQLVIPKDDPNVAAIATRQQTMEFSEMLDGNSMPVAGSDNHFLHRQTMVPQIGNLMAGVVQAPTPQLLGTAKLALDHYRQHLGMDQMTPDPAKAQEEKGLAGWDKELAQAENVLAVAAQQGGLPVAGNPGAAPGAAQEPQALPPEPMSQKDGAEVALRAAELKQKDRQMALEEAKHTHQVQQDHTANVHKGIQLQQDNLSIVSSIAQQSMKAGEQAAQKDLANSGAD